MVLTQLEHVREAKVIPAKFPYHYGSYATL